MGLKFNLKMEKISVLNSEISNKPTFFSENTFEESPYIKKAKNYYPKLSMDIFEDSLERLDRVLKKKAQKDLYYQKAIHNDPKVSMNKFDDKLEIMDNVSIKKTQEDLYYQKTINDHPKLSTNKFDDSLQENLNNFAEKTTEKDRQNDFI